jgi:ABC-2 type transport system permease protein
MDFRKLLQIALKDIQTLVNDRGTLIMLVLTPFALTFIIAAAFGNLNINSGDSPIDNIPIVIANQDQAINLGSQAISFGKQMADSMQNIGLKANDPNKLLTVTTVADETEARALVTQGKARVAVIIPADFSQSLNPADPAFGDRKIRVMVIRDAGNPIPAEIATSVVYQMVNGFANSMIAVNAAIKVNPIAILAAQSISENVAAELNKQSVASVSANTQSTTGTNQGTNFNFLQYFAPAMAVFFLNFTMASGAVSIIEEKDNWTLQRLLISPTNRMTILAGKLGGTYVSGLLQLTVLIIATSLVAPLAGASAPVWGTNILALILLTLIVVASAMGLGTLIAAVSRTRQQANTVANAVLILSGIVGGTFFVSQGGPPMGLLSQLTVNYWANTAYASLAATGDLTAVLPNLGALLVIFVVGFGIGVFLFSRRLDI